MRIFPLVVSCLLVMAAVACSDTSPAAGTDAKPIIADLTGKVIVPTLQRIDLSAGEMAAAVSALSDSPSEQTLSAAQAAWRNARVSWRLADAFRFGPVENLRITAAVDYAPANTATIEKNIEGTDALSDTSFENYGANAKGFLAIEYLIFDNAGNAAVLSKLVGTGVPERRRQYLQLAAANVKKKTAMLLEAWTAGDKPFSRELAEAGGAGTVFPSAKSVVDQLVNSSTFAAEVLANTTIGKPFGKKSGGVPMPDEEVTRRSDHSLDEMTATLVGVVDIYGGMSQLKEVGLGISDLVVAKNPALDTRVSTALADAIIKLRDVPPPFRTAIVSNKDAVEAAYQSVRAAKNMMSTEVAGLLGTTLKFNDNDGD